MNIEDAIETDPEKIAAFKRMFPTAREYTEHGVPVGSSLDRDTWPVEVTARLCDNPLGHHLASAAAEVADVAETRCMSCHQRIYRTDGGGWRS